MVFASPIFLFLFLPAVLVGIVLIRREFRNLFLLLASLVFYSWGEGELVVIMFVSIAANYLFGLGIERARTDRGRRGVLIAGLSLNLALLIFFKYVIFLLENLNPWLQRWSLPVIELGSIHLPLGISFFTFQAMSYIMDVYRRDIPANRHPVDFALYIALFPQLIAGPIVRYRDIAGELLSRVLSIDNLAAGGRRFIVGLGKKALVANTLAVASDQLFALPAGELTTAAAWLGVLCFTLQVYFDFSGYSDMAIGLGRMVGFHFMENFNYPYISKSLTEFWRRWHISLSTWFRDYLYIPLGGNRKGPVRTYANLFIVFVLCGLWHGANWHFVIFGMIHGGVLVIERLGFEAFLKRVWAPLQHLYLVLIILFSFVVFRADTMTYAWEFWGRMVAWHGGPLPAVRFDRELATFLAVGLFGSLPWIPWLKAGLPNLPRLGTLPAGGLALGRDLLLLALLGLSALALSGGVYQSFVYFRF